MDKELTCTLCGGSNFTKEAGYYYCNECQTQSQDIREHILDTEIQENVDISRQKVAKKIRAVPKQEDQLTSWECYNYIIVGLVEELIQLGAQPSLKRVVKLLWFKYLQKLEVVSYNPDDLPKLGIINSTMDAGILYGRRPVRKRSRSRSQSSHSSSSTSNTNSLDKKGYQKEKTKRRRLLIQAEYEKLSATQASEDISLHNQSLSSLRSGSETSKERKYLQYNKGSKKELLTKMSKSHYKSHCQDVFDDLECHKMTHRNTSSTYRRGPYMLCRKTIFAIIYLGLLINKEKIQLGDLLRFIREGNISYYNVNHFFPEEVKLRNLNIKTWDFGNDLFTHTGLRLTSASIAKLLNIAKFIPQQNLVAICLRFCHELNLPSEISTYVLNLISKTPLQLQFTQKSKIIPNYEGRVLCMIIFITKLFFGLDDKTEYKFSIDANKLNSENGESDQKKMFVWKDWVYYINYRKLILQKSHFPTQSLYDKENLNDMNLFFGFINEQNLKYEVEEPELTRELDVLKSLLTRLQNKEQTPREMLTFKASLTPFRDYVNTILNSPVPEQSKYLIEVLCKNFENESLVFLADSFNYWDILSNGKKIGIKHRGANKDLKMIESGNQKREREIWRLHSKKKICIKVTNKKSNLQDNSPKKNLRKLKQRSKDIIKNFEKQNLMDYKKRIRKMIKLKQYSEQTNAVVPVDNFISESQLLANDSLFQSQISSLNDSTDEKIYFHYNPYERFWMNNLLLTEVTIEEFIDFFQTNPESFRFLFSECARVGDMSCKELFEEYNNTEIYLCYVAKFTRTAVDEKHLDKVLLKMIDNAQKNW